MYVSAMSPVCARRTSRIDAPASLNRSIAFANSAANVAIEQLGKIAAKLAEPQLRHGAGAVREVPGAFEDAIQDPRISNALRRAVPHDRATPKAEPRRWSEFRRTRVSVRRCRTRRPESESSRPYRSRWTPIPAPRQQRPRNRRSIRRASASCRGDCAHGPERRFVAGRAERELVQIALADDHGARFAKARDDGRIGLSDVVPADARGGRGRHAFDVDQILDGNRQP